LTEAPGSGEQALSPAGTMVKSNTPVGGPKGRTEIAIRLDWLAEVLQTMDSDVKSESSMH